MLPDDRKTRLEKLQAASDSVSEDLMEELVEQGKKAAANMLMLYGSKSCLDAGGFIHCVANAHEAALLFLLEEEFVTLTDKGCAGAGTIARRQKERAEHDASALNNPEQPAEGLNPMRGTGYI